VGTSVSFGDYGIQALEHAYITNRQIESAGVSPSTGTSSVAAKVWINIFPGPSADQEGPPENPHGFRKGIAGMVDCERQAGVACLFELSYPNEPGPPGRALTRAIHKLPIKARIVTREDQF